MPKTLVWETLVPLARLGRLHDHRSTARKRSRGVPTQPTAWPTDAQQGLNPRNGTKEAHHALWGAPARQGPWEAGACSGCGLSQEEAEASRLPLAVGVGGLTQARQPSCRPGGQNEFPASSAPAYSVHLALLDVLRQQSPCPQALPANSVRFAHVNCGVLWPPDLEIGSTACYQTLVQIHGNPRYLRPLSHSPEGQEGNNSFISKIHPIYIFLS